MDQSLSVPLSTLPSTDKRKSGDSYEFLGLQLIWIGLDFVVH